MSDSEHRSPFYYEYNERGSYTYCIEEHQRKTITHII
nr:MAG TPA: hypothetical protein [Caudoviricetes sp.]